ncbi:MAG: hypothetical protein ACHQ3P_04435, partial [Candidatus Limnocylindrales bacterium]
TQVPVTSAAAGGALAGAIDAAGGPALAPWEAGATDAGGAWVGAGVGLGVALDEQLAMMKAIETTTIGLVDAMPRHPRCMAVPLRTSGRARGRYRGDYVGRVMEPLRFLRRA